jgi:phosphonate transport system substrate-binding protein
MKGFYLGRKSIYTACKEIIQMLNSLVTCGLLLLLIQSVNAESLVLGVYTSEKASSMYQKFSPIIKYLNKDLSERMDRDMDVKLKIYKTYREAQDAIVKGNIDFARFGPASYILVKHRNPNIQLLLMENKKGKKYFNGVIVTANNNEIQSLSDLKDKRFAFGDKSSTIGRYLAQAELIKAGVQASDFQNHEFLGRHDKVFKAVAIGDYDAGALNEYTFKSLNENEELKVIHIFNIVTKPWLTRSDLPADVHQGLQQSLLEIKDESILNSLKIEGFFETNDEMYNFIREGMAAAVNF